MVADKGTAIGVLDKIKNDSEGYKMKRINENPLRIVELTVSVKGVDGE